MPSPFPGMDPYLEGSLWTSVHTQLAAEIARQLTPQLQPKYLALTTERFVMEFPETVAVASSSMYPDVGIARPPSQFPAQKNEPGVLTAPLHMATVIPARVPHVSIEIRDRANRRLVTAIEILSPINKRGAGRREYLAKRHRLLRSSAHLIEIDLLRRGKRVPMEEALPAAPYFVFLSRTETRPLSDIWPIYLHDALPSIPVPLLAGDADARLELQSTLNNVYDLLRYDLAVDYTQDPEVAPTAAEAAWIHDRLRAAGKRG